MSSKKTKYRDTDYLYISVALKVRESKLLTAESFEKLLDTKSCTEALRLLAEWGYPVPEGIEPEEYERVLADEQNAAYAAVKQSATFTAISTALTEIFRIRYDYMNLKAIIKAELLGISPEDMLFGTGTVPAAELCDKIRARRFADLPKGLGEAFTAAQTAFSAEKNPQTVDLVCDKMYFGKLTETAEASGFSFLKKYASLSTDIMNTNAYLRLKLISKPYSFFEDTIYAPGTINTDIYKDCYLKPVGDFFDALSSTVLSPLSVLRDEEKLSLSKVEHICDDILSDYDKTLRRVPFGAEVIASYLLAKEAEIKNTRIVLAGKAAGLSETSIRERLRFGYV